MNFKIGVALMGATVAFAGVSFAAVPESVVPLAVETPTTTPETAAPIEFVSEPQVQLAVEVAEPAAPAIDPREVECVAKVVIHEAGNQSYKGKLAVAQVVRARMNDGRFPRTACAVIKQRGQFFNVDAYNPSRKTALWSEAVEIANDTLSGEHADVVPGALFFHAVGARIPGRKRLGQVGNHIFLR